MLANSSAGYIEHSEEGFEGVYVFPPSWHGLKQQVIYVAQFGGGIQVVEGIVGSGKSTFALWLSDDQEVLPMSMMSMLPTTEPQNLFFELLLQLGLRPSPSAGAGKLLVMLRSYVQSLHREGSRVVMLIDDAHWITDSDLAALISTMQDASEAGLGLHLILMAEPGFARRVDNLQLLDLAVHDGALPPLSVAEVGDLISRRASYSAIDHFEPESAEMIWSQTKGIPGRVLALLKARDDDGRADRMTPVKAAQKVSTASFRGWPIAHFIALIFLSGILVWWYLVQKSDPVPQVRALGVVLPAGNGSDLAGDGLVRTQSGDAALGRALANNNGGDPVQADVDQAGVEVGAQQPKPSAGMGAQENSGTAKVINSDLGSIPPTSDVEQGMIEPDEPAEKVAATKESAESTRAEIKTQDVSVSTQIKEEVSVPKPIKSNPSSLRIITPAKDLVAESEARLLGLPSSAYILQLMASSETNKLMAFLEAQPNRKNLMIYRANRDGKVFHIMVEGFYSDKAAASSASNNLPASQKKAGPWPKRLEFVQKEINEFKRRRPGADR